MSKESLATIATRHQVFLERLKTQTATDFASVIPKLNQAIAEVTGALEVETVDKLTKKQINKLLADLVAAQESIVAQSTSKLKSDLKDIHDYEVGFEARTLEGAVAAAGKPKKVKVPNLSSAWKSTLDQPLSATGQLLEPFVDGWGESHLEGVNRAVLTAWGEGRTVGQLMRDIRGTKAANYQDGLAAVSRRQAEAIARTSVQHVAQQARMSTWDDNKDIVEGYTFVATLDGRTTSKCRSLDGLTFELGKGPVPPVHVNCRSTTIPKLPKEFDFLDEGATRSSKDGYVAADQTYYGWLKTQPESFQDEVLGASRAKLFREGGLTAEKFAALNLGKNFEPLTLAEMQAKEPQLFDKTGVVVKGATAVVPKAEEKFTDVNTAPYSSSYTNRGSIYNRATGDQKDLNEDNSWTNPEFRALSSYKGAGYRGINGYLRKGEDAYFQGYSPEDIELEKAPIKTKIAALDSLMEKSTLAENVYLYRGFEPTFDPKTMIDFTFQDKGFISTSTSPTIAENFNVNVFKIRAKAGSKGIAVESRLGNDLGESKNEFEVLLPRGTMFRFTGNVTETENANIYEVEIVTE